MVTLKRIEIPPQPPGQITIKCPYCPQQFHLNYSETEFQRVGTLLRAAESAIRPDHQFRNHSDAIDLSWRQGVVTLDATTSHSVASLRLRSAFRPQGSTRKFVKGRK